MPRGVYVRTAEYREKQRLAMLGRINPGKNKTIKTRQKIGDAQRGMAKSEDFRGKCSQRMSGKPSFWKGHTHSEDSRRKISESQRQEKHYNWKGGISEAPNYAVSLRRRKAGFTTELFNERLAEQGGCCAICAVTLTTGLGSTSACADHCHETCTPRGILCKRCNLMLGHAGDDPSALRRAADYLDLWKRTA